MKPKPKANPTTTARKIDTEKPWRREIAQADIRELRNEDGNDDEDRRVELSFSSDVPYDRGWMTEILAHDKKNVRLERLNGGAALLLNHDSDKQIGVVESASVDTKGKKGRAVVRFSKSALGEEILQDVRDKIRTLVSVGYRIHTYEYDEKSDVLTATDWEPFEVSIVSVPADAGVGVGRGFDRESRGTTREERNNEEPNEEPNTMPPEVAEAPTQERQQPTIDVKSERETAAKAAMEAERKRAATINEIAKVQGERYPGVRELASKAIQEGTSADDFMHRFLTEEMNGKPVDTDPNIGMNTDEVRSYSVVKAIREMARGGNRNAGASHVTGLEKEAHEAMSKKLGRDLEPGEFLIPYEIETQARFDQRARVPEFQRMEARRALTAGDFASAGALISDDLRPESFIELLRNAMVLPAAGARVLSGLQGDLAIPRQSGGATGYWLSENEEITLDDQTFGQIAMRPKRLGGASRLSNQLINQSSLAVENLVREDLMAVLARKKDLAGLEGTGVSGQPLGIKNTSGIGGVTFGGAAEWADIVEFETDVATANADSLGNFYWIMTPSVRGKWKTILQNTTAGANYIYGPDGRPNGYPTLVTNAITGDIVFFGAFSELIIGDWTGMSLIVDPYTRAKFDQIEVVINHKTDMVVRHPVAFSISTDSGAQ